MIRSTLAVAKALVLFTTVFLIGCGDGSTRNSASPVGPDGEAKITQLAASTGGDFSKLSASDKEYLLKRNGGDSAAAEAELKKYASGY